MDTVVAEPTATERARGERAAAQASPILVAVDFSPDSESALLWACAHAARISAPLEILHVVHDPAEAPGKYRSDDGDPLKPIAEVAEQKLGGFLSDVQARHPETNGLASARTHCCPGLPPAAIVDLARSRGARHLVLGSRGRNGVARLLLGSTSEHVVRHAPMPVTIVKADTT